VRLEYPLLLAFAGVKRMGPGAWKAQHCSEYTRTEWQAYREACADRHGVNAPLDRIELWYDWADRLAGHVAQSYRSGHVFNFLLGAAVVLWPHDNGCHRRRLSWRSANSRGGRDPANTSIGTRQEWHRKWLDYAVRRALRPMRSLKLIGVGAGPTGTAANPRPMGRMVFGRGVAGDRCPTGRLDAKTADLPARSPNKVAPQIAYHRATSVQVERSTTARELGTALFSASLQLRLLLVAFAVPTGLRPQRLVRDDLGGLGDRYGSLRNSLPGRLRRQRGPLAIHRRSA
jgi:hypothetical protein